MRTLIRVMSAPGTPDAGTTLVVAPHPDDETFGCGGLIARKRQLGARVAVLFLTDGESAHLPCCHTPAERIGEARRQDAAHAAEILGVDPNDLIRLHLPDRKIPSFRDPGFEPTCESLMDVIRDVNPQTIFAPHPLDGIPDHRAAARVVRETLDNADFAGNLYHYPVWTWYNPPLKILLRFRRTRAVEIDIRPVQDKKSAAIDYYLSRLNPECGKPLIGNLSPNFIASFRRPYEIFFKIK